MSHISNHVMCFCEFSALTSIETAVYGTEYLSLDWTWDWSVMKCVRMCVCTSEHVIHTWFTLLLVRDFFSHFNYYEYILLIIFLLVDEFLSLHNITGLCWMHLWLVFMYVCVSIGRFCSVWSVVCLWYVRVLVLYSICERAIYYW